jgi:hypothetical protein
MPTHRGLEFEHLLGYEILARPVHLDDRLKEVLRHLRVIRQKLLGILGQAIANIAEGRVVVRLCRKLFELFLCLTMWQQFVFEGHRRREQNND